MDARCLRSIRLLAAAALLMATASVSAQQFRYHNVAGSSFYPRSGGTTVQYGGAGCISRQAGTEWFVSPLQLPQGATIKYVRVFYYDTSGSDLRVALTRYDGAGGYQDEALFSNTGANGGYGQTLSPELTVLVDNLSYATQLLADFGESSPTLKLCGMRLAYTLPDPIFRDGFEN